MAGDAYIGAHRPEGWWFEEDCAWQVLLLAWPELRDECFAEAALAGGNISPGEPFSDQYALPALIRGATFWYGPELVRALGYGPSAEDVERWDRRSAVRP